MPPTTHHPAPSHPAGTPASAKPPQKDGLKSVLSTILLLVLAPLIALFLTFFIIQSYEVDGPSMRTTLSDGDRLIILKVPRTWSRLTGNPFIPARGDIIVFNQRTGVGSVGKKQLIKRVIALPGERIVVQNNTITVYNQEHPEGFSPDMTADYGSVIGDTTGTVDMIVPKGEVFVAGDNRDNSFDSRDFGTISVDDIIGTLSLRVYPFNSARLF